MISKLAKYAEMFYLQSRGADKYTQEQIDQRYQTLRMEYDALSLAVKDPKLQNDPRLPEWKSRLEAVKAEMNMLGPTQSEMTGGTLSQEALNARARRGGPPASLV